MSHPRPILRLSVIALVAVVAVLAATDGALACAPGAADRAASMPLRGTGCCFRPAAGCCCDPSPPSSEALGSASAVRWVPPALAGPPSDLAAGPACRCQDGESSAPVPAPVRGDDRPDPSRAASPGWPAPADHDRSPSLRPIRPTGSPPGSLLDLRTVRLLI